MILTIDAGNTNIKIAAYENERLVFHSRLKTDRNKTKDEYMVLFFDLLSIYKVNPSQIKGCIISCVVPSLNTVLKEAVVKTVGCKVMVVGTGIKTGLNIKIDNPATLGSDLVAAATGAIKKYKLPCVIVSVGTATTFCVVDEDKSFIGGAILPGIDISLQALASNSDQLPAIGLDPPKSVVGKNTIDCMNAGVIYGNAAMIDGMAQRYKDELKKDVTVVATGGRAKYIVPFCLNNVILDKQLIIEGLLELYRKNMK